LSKLSRSRQRFDIAYKNVIVRLVTRYDTIR